MEGSSDIVPASPLALEYEALQLHERLADVELQLATLEAELASFEADYMRQVGSVMAQARDLEAQMLAIVAERSGSPGDAEAAAHARERARQSTAELEAVAGPPPPPPSDDLKKLFRDAAKRLHPDRFAGDEAAYAHAEAFMKRLNEAYRAGDADAIGDLIRQWEASPLGQLPEDEGARLAQATREIRALRVAVAEAEERLHQAQTSEYAQLLERVMAAAAGGDDLMAEMRAAALAALADAQARLAAITSAP